MPTGPAAAVASAGDVAAGGSEAQDAIWHLTKKKAPGGDLPVPFVLSV